jgi:hypothetical protein
MQPLISPESRTATCREGLGSESSDPLAGGLVRRSCTAKAFRITAEAGSRNVPTSGSDGVNQVLIDSSLHCSYD